MIRQPRQSKDRLSIKFGVVQTVEEMETTWPGRGEADAESARELRVCAGHEGSCLLVSDLDELRIVACGLERPQDGVDAVAGVTKDPMDAPLTQPLQQELCNRRL